MNSFPSWLKNVLARVRRDRPESRREPRRRSRWRRVTLSFEQLESRITPAGPTVSAVSPDARPVTGAGAGAGQITITGTNCILVKSVYFGSVAAPSYTVTSPTSISVMAPSESYGVVDVTVTTAGGTSPTNTGTNIPSHS